MTDTLRDHSRRKYVARNMKATDTEIQTGSLQRIADATEMMCRDRERMERKIRDLRASSQWLRDQLDRERRSNASLRGVITKMKRRVEG